MSSPAPIGVDDRQPGGSEGERLWHAVDELLARATPEGTLHHGLGTLGAKRLRRLGRPVPEELQREERAAALFTAMAVPALRRVRESCDGPLLLIKGAEVASLYPPGGRAFSDADLLTPDPESVQASLLEAGFEVDQVGVAATYHLQPLILPTLPLQVEVHEHVKWPARLGRPPLAEIVEAGVPAALGVDGILTPRPAHHALIIAAHSWEHRPFRIIRDLLDIALLTADLDEHEVMRTAEAWNLGPIWRTTRGAVEHLFHGGRKTVPLRTWAKHIAEVRDRTVLESHLEHWLSPFWGLPTRIALPNTIRVARDEISPLPGESWSGKLRRSSTALRHAGMTLTRHDAHEERPAQAAPPRDGP